MSWDTVKFNELYAVDSKNGIYKSAENHGTGTKIVNMGELFAYGFIGGQDMRRIEVTDKEKESFGVIEGDLLFARRSLVESGAGKSSIIKDLSEPTVFESSIIRVRLDKNKCNPLFYYYWLMSYDGRSEISSLVNGVNVKGIKSSSLKDITVAHPSMEIQNRIADILYHYDELIENDQKQIKLLEEAAQRLYKEWFVDLRFPGYEETEFIDEIPMGWNETTIDSFIELQSGYAFKSSSFDDAGNYKIVTIKNVQDGAFDGDNVNKILEIPDKMPPHCKLQEGDSLLSLTGNVGRVCTVIGDNYLLNQRVAKIVSEYPCFSYCLFRSDKMFHDMNNLANGAAQQNLSPIKTGQLRIIKPDDEMILKFEQMVKPILNKKNILNRDILIAAQARNRLLPKLMNGEIEV